MIYQNVTQKSFKENHSNLCNNFPINVKNQKIRCKSTPIVKILFNIIVCPILCLQKKKKKTNYRCQVILKKKNKCKKTYKQKIKSTGGTEQNNITQNRKPQNFNFKSQTSII